jgi:hypothetical protein
MLMSAAGDNLVVPDLVSFSSVCRLHQSSDPAGLEKAAKVFKRAGRVGPEGSMEFPDIIFFGCPRLHAVKPKTQPRGPRNLYHMEELSLKVATSSRTHKCTTPAVLTQQVETLIVSKRHRLFAKMKDMHADGNIEAGPDVLHTTG